jgi:hypothetical protein
MRHDGMKLRSECESREVTKIIVEGCIIILIERIHCHHSLDYLLGVAFSRVICSRRLRQSGSSRKQSLIRHANNL